MAITPWDCHRANMRIRKASTTRLQLPVVGGKVAGGADSGSRVSDVWWREILAGWGRWGSRLAEASVPRCTTCSTAGRPELLTAGATPRYRIAASRLDRVRRAGMIRTAHRLAIYERDVRRRLCEENWNGNGREIRLLLYPFREKIIL